MGGVSSHVGVTQLWRAVITELAMVAALSVLSTKLCVNLEAVAMCTIGSDYVVPISSESDYMYPDTMRLMSAFDPEKHWVPHRYHTVQAKVAARELEQNLTPCKLKTDSDWSENGEIIVPDQMQQEYWHIHYYSRAETLPTVCDTS